MKVNVNNIELNYVKSGTGKPLLLLHGNGEDLHIFDRLREKLSNNYTVYCIDSRNHGQSSKTEEFSYEIMMSDIVSFIEVLQLDKVSIVGFSDGAIIALLLGLNYPQYLDKLVLLGVNLSPNDFTERSYQYIKDYYEETGDPLYKLMLEEPNIGLESLKSLNIETLLIIGEREMFKPETYTNILSTLPYASLKIMEGHNHNSYVVDNDVLYKDLVEFLGS